MADGSKQQYIPGRGLPCYLLDRLGDDSSIYSHGASRVSVGTNSSSSIERNTDASNSINTLPNYSLFNSSNVGSMSFTSGISDQNILEHQTSKPMTEKVKKITERVWFDSVRNSFRIAPESIQQQIRARRDSNRTKFFQTNEYPEKMKSTIDFAN